MTKVLLALGLTAATAVAAVASGYAFVVFQLGHCFDPGDGTGALLEPPPTQGLVCGSDSSLQSLSFLAFVVAALLGAGLVWLVWRNASGVLPRLVASTAPVVVPLAAYALLGLA
ncbi:hypothetical protein H5V45_09835 [Nocardioides sp. KIGAM211]|uniref:Uncharacterized protein n=1 Tax=Nocardioides luti TaxID=2761101 RepID=A0A7X0RG16_9ACTN|nr:hypothetical protein [Nocardioides luti]MBB6627621.1 hypothetical protein [Nocardioides luti]